MTNRAAAFLLLCFLSWATTFAQEKPTPNARAVENPPAADHHQHVASPEMVVFQGYANQGITAITAENVIKLLDAAGIQKGVLLSTAYAYGRPGREPQDEYTRVKAENDWVGAQAALYPKRLVAFCGFNPLKDYAVDEITRCARDPRLNRGIKLHFGNSDVQLEKPEHLEKLKAVFRAANANRMAIVVHARASISLDRPYGAEQARLFLEQLMPLAANITVQIAHLAGSGPGYDDSLADAALEVYIGAIAKHDPRTKNLWFDLTSNANPANSPERSALLAKRIRSIGVKRVLYGTDVTIGPFLSPRDSWAEVCRLDLSDKEIKTVAKNKAPYLR